jgi:tRNA G18 (ribose-2'-O)-methylase SpoU
MSTLHLIAHDIRSRENVGSLFRTSDSLGVTKLWLTGYTPAPPDEKISKVALGAEKSVAFEKRLDIVEVIKEFKARDILVYALELTPEAIELSSFVPPQEMALLLGTEVTGIPASLLELCDGAIKMTQRGIKESMNVAVATGIASWKILWGSV